MRSESEMTREAKQATPREQLLKELMDSREPKTEREHAAAREIIKLRSAAGQALEALIWTTGSADFGEGGKAREGALNLLFPAIADLRDALAEANIKDNLTVEPVAWLIESYDIYAKRTLQRLVFYNPKNMHGVKITAYYAAPPRHAQTWTQAHWTEYERGIVSTERERIAAWVEDMCVGLDAKTIANGIRNGGNDDIGAFEVRK